MRPLRVILWDRSALGGARGPGLLALAWRVGVALYRALGRVDVAFGATSWDEALRWLAAVSPERPIGSVQFWGHGRWGMALIAHDRLDVRALEAAHPLHDHLCAIHARMTATSSWWFRTCETFGRTDGHEFARRWARFFGCAAAGHTHVIGAWQSGLHSLRPGEAPSWSVDEGVSTAHPGRGASSHPFAPNTITCLHGRVPDGW